MTSEEETVDYEPSRILKWFTHNGWIIILVLIIVALSVTAQIGYQAKIEKLRIANQFLAKSSDPTAALNKEQLIILDIYNDDILSNYGETYVYCVEKDKNFVKCQEIRQKINSQLIININKALGE